MRPRCFELLVGELMEDPTLDAVFCRTLDCDEQLEPYASYLGEQAFHRRGVDPLGRHVKRGRDWYRLSFDGYQLWHSNAQMHRRTILEAVGGWDERWGCAADTDLILRILERDGWILHHPYCGVLYRRRQGSVSHVYETKGWKAIEGMLIHLTSLRRQYENGRRMDMTLIKSWYRYWTAWCGAKETLRRGERQSSIPVLRNADVASLTAALCPPRAVRLGFAGRRAAGSVTRKVRRSLDVLRLRSNVDRQAQRHETRAAVNHTVGDMNRVK
jgi:hypothetical protein